MLNHVTEIQPLEYPMDIHYDIKNIPEIPPDILFSIFKQVDQPTLYTSCTRVSKTWNSLISSNNQQSIIKTTKIYHMLDILRINMRVKHIKSLDLSGFSFIDKSAHQVTHDYTQLITSFDHKAFVSLTSLSMKSCTLELLKVFVPDPLSSNITRLGIKDAHFIQHTFVKEYFVGLIRNLRWFGFSICCGEVNHDIRRLVVLDIIENVNSNIIETLHIGRLDIRPNSDMLASLSNKLEHANQKRRNSFSFWAGNVRSNSYKALERWNSLFGGLQNLVALKIVSKDGYEGIYELLSSISSTCFSLEHLHLEGRMEPLTKSGALSNFTNNIKNIKSFILSPDIVVQESAVQEFHEFLSIRGRNLISLSTPFIMFPKENAIASNCANLTNLSLQLPFICDNQRRLDLPKLINLGKKLPYLHSLLLIIEPRVYSLTLTRQQMTTILYAFPNIKQIDLGNCVSLEFIKDLHYCYLERIVRIAGSSVNFQIVNNEGIEYGGLRWGEGFRLTSGKVKIAASRD